MNKFKFLKSLFSPFKPVKFKFYFGEIKLGTPYFLPRRWVRSDKPGYKSPIPKKIGFDFVGLGWKTKWSDKDYRFESGPIWSFVFFKWQFAITFQTEHLSEYWEAWLYYEINTDKTKSIQERVNQCKREFPLTYTSSYSDGRKETINYYDLILKEKYK